MTQHFSQATKTLIATSREVAIDLGYDYISTIHLFLADCRNNDRYSIKDFAFRSPEELQQFYDSQIIGNPTIYMDSLPLTLEAEKTIKKAIQLRKTRYKDNEVHPYHLFLAASQIKGALLHSIIQPKEQFFERLEKYYVNLGAITQPAAKTSLWAKLFK